MIRGLRIFYSHLFVRNVNKRRKQSQKYNCQSFLSLPAGGAKLVLFSNRRGRDLVDFKHESFSSIPRTFLSFLSSISRELSLFHSKNSYFHSLSSGKDAKFKTDLIKIGDPAH